MHNVCTLVHFILSHPRMLCYGLVLKLDITEYELSQKLRRRIAKTIFYLPYL